MPRSVRDWDGALCCCCNLPLIRFGNRSGVVRQNVGDVDSRPIPRTGEQASAEGDVFARTNLTSGPRLQARSWLGEAHSSASHEMWIHERRRCATEGAFASAKTKKRALGGPRCGRAVRSESDILPGIFSVGYCPLLSVRACLVPGSEDRLGEAYLTNRDDPGRAIRIVETTSGHRGGLQMRLYWSRSVVSEIVMTWRP